MRWVLENHSALRKSSPPNGVEAACCALRVLAQHESSIAQLAESAAIEPLVRLLTKGLG